MQDDVNADRLEWREDAEGWTADAPGFGIYKVRRMKALCHPAMNYVDMYTVTSLTPHKNSVRITTVVYERDLEAAKAYAQKHFETIVGKLEPKVTPKMVHAGVVALEAWEGNCHAEMLVAEVYSAMARAAADRNEVTAPGSNPPSP